MKTLNTDPLCGTLNAIGYARVSTTDQLESGHGLDAQRRTIESEVSRRTWSLSTHYTDAASGKSLLGRPALADALNALTLGHAQVLVVAKLDRLSRSLVDFAGLMARARDEGWSLVAVDLGVDTSTPNGQLVANIFSSIAEWERQLISLRTREALRAAQARGVRLGRPRSLAPEVVARIVALRDSGMSLQAIADRLEDDGVPTARGGKRWYPSTLKCVLDAA